ncbi:carnosine N-methyltransferase-like [Zophobas morio]|uniref:carnosine N-methyltransferase-like n=1 Tax=Zophobas morio TaxID=2755281 RepID=UPI003082DB34
MLLASNFILNRSGDRKFVIHPFVSQYNNNIGRSDQYRSVLVPDVNINKELKGNGKMSMTAGEFLECYTEAASQSISNNL